MNRGRSPDQSSRKTASGAGIEVEEYRARRQRVLAALKGAAGVVLAGEAAAPRLGRWRADPNFIYLTGISDEPGAAVLFDPTADDPARRIVLLLRSRDPEIERWEGLRSPLDAALKRRSGFDSIYRSSRLPWLLTHAARRGRELACLHPFAVFPADVSADLALFRRVAERVPGVQLVDQTQLLPALRAIKSPAEMAMMRRAVDATVAGFAAATRMIRPGVNEAQIAAALEDGYRAAGGTGVAYNTIVGAGPNGAILHYEANDQRVNDGDLIVIDSGAEYRGYASDVTRTYPASGKFTADQRELYEIVLRAELAGIKATRVGATMRAVDAASRAVIEKAGLGDAFMHSIGHPLGLEVHDVAPEAPLKAGMVVTIEPGIYLPNQELGIRIEDDILITPRGNENLTAKIPKTIAEIEAALR